MAKKIVTKKATAKKPTATKASRKTTKKPAAKKVAKKKPLKKKAASTGGKVKFLAGEICCITGRFSYYPSKEELLKFLKAQGAKVVEKVTDDVTILVVGEGKKTTKEKSAEALNKAGSSIRIIEPSDLSATMIPEIPAMIVDPDRIKAATDLLGTYWLLQNSGVEFKGEQFSKVSFGKSLKTHIEFQNLSFANCLFKACTWTNICYGWSDTKSEDCVFEKNVFNDTRMQDLKGCTITKASGTSYALSDLDNCKILDSKFDSLSFNDLQNTDVVNCTIKTLELDAYYSSPFKNCTFSKITANDVKLCETTFRECELKDVKLSNIKAAENYIRFEKCKLTNVQFKNANIKEIIFENCELTNCVFDKIEGQLLDLGNSKISKCKFIQPKFAVMHVSEEQQKGVTGVDVSNVISDLKQFKEIKKLAQTIQKANKVVFSFDGPMEGGDLVTVSTNSEYWYETSYAAKKDKKHASSTRVQTWGKVKTSDIASKLVWAFQAAKFTDINLGSIKLKTSKCPLKPKDMKQLIVSAAYEAIGQEAKTEAEIKEAEKAAKAKSKGSREAVIAELQANQIAKVNRRTIAELKSCCPFKKVDLKGKTLKAAKFSNLIFEECDFTDADLSKAKFADANCRKSKFVGADLSGADFKNAKLRNVDLTNANLSNAKLLSTDLTDAN